MVHFLASVTSVLSNAILRKARHCPSTDVCCCIPIFSFTLSPTFSLGAFIWTISAVVWSWHLDMFGEAGGPGLFSGGTFLIIAPQRLRKRNHLKLYLQGLCGRQSGSTLCSTLSRPLLIKNSPTGGLGPLWERTYVLVVTKYFPQLLLWAQAGFHWPALNEECVPFPCKNNFSSTVSACAAAKAVALWSVTHTFGHQKGVILTIGRQKKKASEAEFACRKPCMVESLCENVKQHLSKIYSL